MRPLLAAVILVLARAASADDGLQDRIHRARGEILPKTVYIYVVGRQYEEGAAKRGIWTGSGVILSTDGYVATNHHVLDQAQRVRVMLSDSRAYEAHVVGTDEDTDLGLLQLDLPRGHPPLPAAEFGDSGSLSAGDFVLAVGSPFGLTRSVSFGIVNNSAQLLDEGGLYDWVQTDAAINPGNSGGPLVDLDGRVMGINTRGGRTIGFAIPSNVAREILARLRRDGRVERSELGLSLQALRDFERDSYVAGERGALVVGVEPGSPAAAGGFQPGDFLLSAGGAPIDALFPERMPDVRRLLAGLAPGRPARFEILRKGRPLTLTAAPKRRLSARPDQEFFAAEEWMLTARQIKESEDNLSHYLRPGGCFILGVSENGNAARSGLRPYDILLKAGGTEIRSLEDLRQVYWRSLRKKPSERLLLLSVLRRGRPLQLALDFTHPPSVLEER